MIRNIIIVEDSATKLSVTKEALQKVFPMASIQTASCIDGATYLMSRERAVSIIECYDTWLVVIDMQLPQSDGEDVLQYGGEKILRMMRENGLQCTAVINSSESVDADFMRRTYDYVEGCVTYHEDSNYMIGALTDLLEAYIDDPEDTCTWYRDTNYDTECGHTYFIYIRDFHQPEITEDRCPWCGKLIEYEEPDDEDEDAWEDEDPDLDEDPDYYDEDSDSFYDEEE